MQGEQLNIMKLLWSYGGNVVGIMIKYESLVALHVSYSLPLRIFSRPPLSVARMHIAHCTYSTHVALRMVQRPLAPLIHTLRLVTPLIHTPVHTPRTLIHTPWTLQDADAPSPVQRHPSGVTSAVRSSSLTGWAAHQLARAVRAIFTRCTGRTHQ